MHHRPLPLQPFTRPAALLALALVAVAALLWAVPAHAQPVQDFDKWCKWKRGAQAWATLTPSSDEVHQGSTAGKLDYDFPADEEQNFVVFQCAKPLTGTPQTLSLWVYGDGSGHLLNAWVQDAAGLRWQFAFGPVDFEGWQHMTATLLPGQPWPSGPLDGSDTDTLVYPIRFDGLALDNPGSGASTGTLYLDDLTAGGLTAGGNSGGGSGSAAAQPKPTPTPAASGAAGDEEGSSGADQAQEAEVDFYADDDALAAGDCTHLRWTVRHVQAYFVEGKGKAGDTGKQEVCPEATTTYTLRVRTLDDQEQEYTVEVQVTGEPSSAAEQGGEGEQAAGAETGEAIVVTEPEVLSPALGLQGIFNNSGISSAAIAECAQARQLKCKNMSQYASNPSFSKATQTCLVWLERGAAFGPIDIVVNRQSDPSSELWASSRDSLGTFACIGLPVKITARGTYEAVLTANGVSKGVEWKVK